MGKFLSDQNQVGFYYTSGTYVNPTGALQWVGMVTDHSITEEEGIIPLRYIGNANRDVDKFIDGPRDVTGTLTYYPQDWKFFMYALGSNVDSGSPTPYIHAIEAIDSGDGNAFTSGAGNPFLSFEMYDGHQFNPTGLNFVREVKGCMVNTMSISASQGDIMEVSIDYIGQSVDYSSGALVGLTSGTLRPFLWADVQLDMPSGTSIDELKDFTFTINNNLEAPHYLNGSRVIDVPIPLNRDYELTVTIDSNSTSVKSLYSQYFKSGTTFNSTLIIGPTAGERDCIISLSGCRITSMEAPTPNEGTDELSLTIVPKTCSVLVNDAIFKYNVE